MVAETMCTSRKQVIELPDVIDPNKLVTEDKMFSMAGEVKMISKRPLKLKIP